MAGRKEKSKEDPVGRSRAPIRVPGLTHEHLTTASVVILKASLLA